MLKMVVILLFLILILRLRAFDRQFVKKPVMTIPYSISVFGIKNQLASMGKKIKTPRTTGKGYTISYLYLGCAPIRQK
jgi:hypothetical protein